MIFCLMSLTALAGAWCGTSLLFWRLHGKNAPQVSGTGKSCQGALQAMGGWVNRLVLRCQAVTQSSSSSFYCAFLELPARGSPGCCGTPPISFPFQEQPAADLSSLGNAPDLWKGQAEEMQRLRDEVTRLAAEIRSINKEVQQMRVAVSEPVEVPDWALKSTGTAIDLQRSSSTSAWLRRVFWSLFSQTFEDTFVQGLDEAGHGETLLGSFLYSVQKGPTQTFPLQNGIPRAFRLLKLGIQNNWGKPTNTCLYRVQVHGKMVETNVIGKTHEETFPR
ncbi:uncharacterized protein LOC134160467 isoform X2 [Pezoporus occidentalis]|uniref:uncharacterized protein LOC134160467 isoform X2 n=1 Tax=Pezoporus occidentalis TaxID=407982 RepID=UPI002F90E68C